MRPQLNLRARLILAVSALCFATMLAGSTPVPARSDTKGTSIGSSLSERRLDVRAGRAARVRGKVRPAGTIRSVALQAHRRGRWTTLADDRTDRTGRFALTVRVRQPGSVRVRLRFRAAVRTAGAARRRSATRGLGRLNVFRSAYASWYGPGLYGGRLACGGRLTPGTLGVAHKRLPCGTRVTLRHRGRVARVRVVDRGPYVGGREFDLTAATARRLGFSGHGAVLVAR